jgi:bleomycin hydrolase
MRTYLVFAAWLIIANLPSSMLAEKLDSAERFTVIKKIETSPIKNQGNSITCWSFTSIAFIEAELQRLGKGDFNLSEMYVVHQVYLDKADHYVRLHGMASFTGGGALSDAFYVLTKYGLVPEEAYTGLKDGSRFIEHFTMDAVLKDYVDALVKNNRLPSAWKDGFKGILDAYMGRVPETFVYKGKSYTPRSFGDYLAINPDDYVQLSSFIYKLLYEKFIVEVPDNWTMATAYNLQLDELIATLDNSINMGYTVALTLDNTELGFNWQKGIIMATPAPAAEIDNSSHSPAVWIPKMDTMPQIFQEVIVTPELRQQAFDNYETTDDHGVLIIGIANDQKGKKFYIAKNSWGTATQTNGYLYISESYIRYKTLTIMVNKAVVPSEIGKKIKIAK